MAEQREIILEQMLKVLKDIETNTCDKQFFPDTNLLEKKIDHIIELHEKEIELLKTLGNDRCTCKKNKARKVKKEKKEEKKDKKEKKIKKS
jgi:hypothetical protein